MFSKGKGECQRKGRDVNEKKGVISRREGGGGEYVPKGEKGGSPWMC